MENRIVASVESRLDFESEPTVERSLSKGEKEIFPAPVEIVIRQTSDSKMMRKRVVWMIRLGVIRGESTRTLAGAAAGEGDFKKDRKLVRNIPFPPSRIFDGPVFRLRATYRPAFPSWSDHDSGIFGLSFPLRLRGSGGVTPLFPESICLEY